MTVERSWLIFTFLLNSECVKFRFQKQFAFQTILLIIWIYSNFWIAQRNPYFQTRSIVFRYGPVFLLIEVSNGGGEIKKTERALVDENPFDRQLV